MNKDYVLEVIFIGERESLFVFLRDDKMVRKFLTRVSD